MVFYSQLEELLPLDDFANVYSIGVTGKISNNKVFVIVDNFRFGGAQRLAIDQALMIADAEEHESIFICSMAINGMNQDSNFIDIEYSRIFDKNIVLIEASKSNYSSSWKFLSNLHTTYQLSNSRVLSHSLRATLILRIYSILLHFRFRQLVTFIHQMPRFASKLQRIKRIFYVQSSQQLFIFSQMALEEWEKTYRIASFFLRKKPKVLRNGIFLPRLPIVKKDILNIKQNLRIVRLSRNVNWKNSISVSELSKTAHRRGIKFEFLLMTSMLDESEIEGIRAGLKHRIEIVVGKGIDAYQPKTGDVHIYPTNYGSDVLNGESVSINCLEMAALGIPSLVSRYSKTWTELFELGIIEVCDFNSIDLVLNKLLIISKRDFSANLVDIRKIVNIENQIQKLKLLE